MHLPLSFDIARARQPRSFIVAPVERHSRGGSIFCIEPFVVSDVAFSTVVAIVADKDGAARLIQCRLSSLRVHADDGDVLIRVLRDTRSKSGKEMKHLIDQGKLSAEPRFAPKAGLKGYFDAIGSLVQPRW